jgi:NACalpha-BTF3-like transcription factor
VQVKGKVSEVCARMGCWMQLVEAGKAVRIKVNDGDIVFPKSAVGKTAVAEGTLRKLELTKEQAVARARHEAEERGTPFDPDSVTSGATIYQIQGTGAVILD